MLDAILLAHCSFTLTFIDSQVTVQHMHKCNMQQLPSHSYTPGKFVFAFALAIRMLFALCLKRKYLVLHSLCSLEHLVRVTGCVRCFALQLVGTLHIGAVRFLTFIFVIFFLFQKFVRK